jgi:lycopene beta-cyclase
LKTADRYDYIICGAGCAGLSLLVHMIRSERFATKRILLVEREEKRHNDRTWCFWETTAGVFEDIVFRQWKEVWFYSQEISRKMDIAPYTYKMIRGVDFYRYCFDLIGQQKNIDLIYGEVSEFVSTPDETGIVVNGQRIGAEYVFNSILFSRPELKKNEYWLLQHFKGWIIETSEPAFDPDTATMMDFRVDQERGTTFTYVMPFSSTKALVEYTLFTEQLLQPQEYDAALKEYISRFLSIAHYTVTEEEFGVIPMTNYKFPPATGNIIHIGTAGGQTKASSGYTFRFIQKQSAVITNKLANGAKPFSDTSSRRFHFYDSTLLHILKHGKLRGHDIFSDLFKKNKPQHILRFLDNETRLSEEFRIMSSLPTWPFLKAAIQQL